MALTVILAGCGGVASDGGDGASDGGSDGASDGAGDGAGDGSDGSDGGDGGDGGDGAADDSEGFDVADSDRLLREAGSFTAEWTFTTTDAEGVTNSVTDSYRVDLDANRSRETFTMSGPEAQTDFETFYADGTTYTRYGDGEQVFYQVVPQEAELFESALARGAFGYDSVDEARFVGTETFDGVSVDRYEYSDPAVWRQYGAGAFGTEENVTITEFRVVVLVDEDGLARMTSWTLSGETETGQPVSADWRYTLTGIGSTSVEDPDWLAEAEAQQQAGSALERPPLAPE
nr:hypothetical protein [Halomicroarcula marina]